ncbi:MAG TPA: hypothetical protein VGI55_03805 [Solirubrobacteraceae bacterium]
MPSITYRSLSCANAALIAAASVRFGAVIVPGLLSSPSPETKIPWAAFPSKQRGSADARVG